MFCADDCPICLFLKEKWDNWSLQTLRDIPIQRLQGKLWRELIKVGTEVNNGNSQEFLSHLAQKYHLYLLSIEDSFRKVETKDSSNLDSTKEQNTVGFSIEYEGNLVSISLEEYKLFAVRILGELHVCLLHHGYLSRWLIEVYRFVRILKLIQSSSNYNVDCYMSKDIRFGIWNFMSSYPEMIRKYANYVLNRLSIIISYGMERDISVALFSLMKTEKDFEYQFLQSKYFSHFVGKESTTLLQKLLSEDSETVYSPGMILSSQHTNRPKFINLEQNWDRLIHCFRKWNGEIRDGNAGVLDISIIRSLFEELLPENMEAFTKRWLYMLFQECIHGEEQALANIQRLGVATSLERMHHLQSRMNPCTVNQSKRTSQDHFEGGYSYLFRGKERFFMEMIESADSSRWNGCLIQLVHLMIEKIIQYLDKLNAQEESRECSISFREQCMVDCVLYGRLATKILALVLTLTGPHKTRNSNHPPTSRTRKRLYVYKRGSFQKKETESMTSHRMSLETDNNSNNNNNNNEADSLSYVLKNLHFDSSSNIVSVSNKFNSVASNYWLLYTNSFTYLKDGMELFPTRFSYALSLFVLWTPYLAVASIDEIISQTPWFTQCMEWIGQVREELYAYFLSTEKEKWSSYEIRIYGWALLLNVIEEQIPLAHISSWINKTSKNSNSLFSTNSNECLFGDILCDDFNKERSWWWMDKRLFWHCLPHMKQLHHVLLHTWDEIREDSAIKLPVTSCTLRGKSRKIQPSLAVVPKSIECTGYDKSDTKACFPHNCRYAEELEPIQQLVQRVLEKKMCSILETLEIADTTMSQDMWWQSTGASLTRAYHVCLNLYKCTVKDLLRNLDVPLDTIDRAVDETYCRTIQPWLGKQNKSPLEILQWIKKSTDSNQYTKQKGEIAIRNEIQGNIVTPTEEENNYLQVYQQLVEENPIATRLENFLLQQLQCFIHMDTETYQKFGVYQLEKRWLQWISVLLDSCAQMEGEETNFPKLTEWLWKHLSYDNIHPLVQSSLALVISKSK